MVATETVVIVRDVPGGKDRYGDPVPGVQDRIDVHGCVVWESAGAESPVFGRDPAEADWTVSMPAGTDVTRTDRVEVRGVVCDVVRTPFEQKNPFTGERRGVVVHVKHAEG